MVLKNRRNFSFLHEKNRCLKNIFSEKKIFQNIFKSKKSFILHILPLQYFHTYTNILLQYYILLRNTTTESHAIGFNDTYIHLNTQPNTLDNTHILLQYYILS
jgi:hypothetical protein